MAPIMAGCAGELSIWETVKSPEERFLVPLDDIARSRYDDGAGRSWDV